MSGDDPVAARVRLLAQVEEAARSIAPLWPLSTAIAVNPLWDLRQMSFHQAVRQAQQVLGISGYPSWALFAQAYATGRVTAEDLRAVIDGGSRAAASRDVQAWDEPELGIRRWQTAAERHDDIFGSEVAASVDREVAKWCAAYLAGIVPAGPTGGFHAAWRTVVVFDPSARSLAGGAGRKRLAELGTDPEDTILTCLDLLGIGDEDRVPELARHLGRMPGWAGHAKWRSRWAAPDHPGPSLHLVDYLAVRLCYEAVLLANEAARPGSGTRRTGKRRRARTAPHARSEGGTHALYDGHPDRAGGAVVVDLPDDVRRHLGGLSATALADVWLAAYEAHFRDRLLAALDRPPLEPPPCPEAQVVFCIDVRSEGLRHQLEACGPYETLGFAGFFALPIRFGPWWSDEATDLCPVLLRPSARLGERPVSSTGAAERELTGRQAVAASHRAFDATRKGALSQFLLAEAGGMVAGPVVLAKTLAPSWYQAVRRWAHQVIAPAAAAAVDVDPPASAMSDDEQALLAEAALTTMGLTRRFAPLVVLCGHGSTTENNPYASSLDCGACGGNRGGPSARAAAAILNRQAIRALLAERGITIPATSVFLAAEHDTATDTVTVLDTHLVPQDHAEGVATLQSALDRAGAATAAGRAPLLPGTDGRHRVTDPAGRAADWAQVRPEWGLARNAALIAAPRSVSAGVSLGSRCFLHSYDAVTDPDGVALETILTAPMVVAHWINAQYYFSTVDPDILSAGDKTAHNIVAGVGVVQGAGGDLRVGLPLQSLYDGDRAYHEPVRLLLVVEAPEMLLEAVIARNPVLQDLFDGQWVHVAAREDGHDHWKIRRAGGTWVRWTPAGARTEEDAARG